MSVLSACLLAMLALLSTPGSVVASETGSQATAAESGQAQPAATLYSCNLINTTLQCREYRMADEAVELTKEWRQRCESMDGRFAPEPCPLTHQVSQCRNIVRGKLLVKEIWLKTNYENADSAIYTNHYYTEAARTVSSPLPVDAMRWNRAESERICQELKGDFIPTP